METTPGIQLLSAREIDTKIHRLAYEILDRHPKEKFILVGIHRRGVPLAQRLAKVLEVERAGVETGMLDITLYRDDPPVFLEKLPYPTRMTSFSIHLSVFFVPSGFRNPDPS